MINFNDDKSFIENYERLKSSRKMAELYGCSKNTITKHATKIKYDYSKFKEKKVSSFPPEEVYQKYLELKTLKAVGEFYGCSNTAVGNFLKKNGYQLKNQNEKLTDVSDEEFIGKYDELKSADKVGAFYGCSGTAVLQRAHKIGYNPNSNKEYKLSEQDKKEIIEAYETVSSTKLANKYNVSRGMITKLWHDANLLGKTIIEEPDYIDITGQTFGKWTVIKKVDTRKNNGSVYWLCRCECGIEREVSSASLRNGLSLSCGAHKNISKGNEKIKTLLQEANIPFELEHTFESCKDKKVLPFDFFVNNQYLIEYDGE